MIVKIPNIVKRIALELKNNGNQAYIVGGSVRDSVLGEEPKDFDIATDLFVDHVIELFKDKDFVSDVKKTGDKFPVARIFTTCKNEFEIATFRKDISFEITLEDFLSFLKERDLKKYELFKNSLKMK